MVVDVYERAIVDKGRIIDPIGNKPASLTNSESKKKSPVLARTVYPG